MHFLSRDHRRPRLMLVNLSIRDFVLIHRLELAFDRGLTVLTGETGAGKSILLDALGLALGARGDTGFVRRGAEETVVTAAFAPDPEHPVRHLIDDLGLATDDGVILRRHLTSAGRSRAFINDNPASVALLRKIGEGLVEVEGQTNGRGLLNPENQRHLLDQFGGLETELKTVARTHGFWHAANEEFVAERSAFDSARRDGELLRHMLAELDGLAPQPGEETFLAERRKTLMRREQVASAVAEALTVLSAEPGVEQRLANARRSLARVAEHADEELGSALESLDRSAVEFGEALNELTAAGRSLSPDAAQLEEVEQRLFGLRALARKHGVDVDGLARLRDEMAQKLAALEDRGETVARKKQEAEAARKAFTSACEQLSETRARATDELNHRVTAEFAPLKLRQAIFTGRLQPLPEDAWSAAGAEKVCFDVVTNPGADPAAIGSVASGGELARINLAVKVVLARTSSAPTLIFDEVDANIGGAVAAAVGDRLARLGKRFQVLAVTHSPQVAARATRHFRVVKDSRAQRAATRIETLDTAARREEVARMLAGRRVTDEARAAADSLLFNGGA